MNEIGEIKDEKVMKMTVTEFRFRDISLSEAICFAFRRIVFSQQFTGCLPVFANDIPFCIAHASCLRKSRYESRVLRIALICWVTERASFGMVNWLLARMNGQESVDMPGECVYV